MDKAKLASSTSSPYQDCCIVLPTKHQKYVALAPAFESILGAGVLEYIIDTDKLGTFNGEIERKVTAFEAAK